MMPSRLYIGAVMLGAVMISQSASALSCARPDLVQTLEDAKASPKIYHVLVGRFLSRADRPQHGGYGSPEDQFTPKPPILTPAVFEGVSLATSPGQDYPLRQFRVDIETSCIGPWCSSPPDSSQELISFVEARDGRPPILRISPCPNSTFQAEAKAVRKLRQCLTRVCQSEGRSW
jgi:hypothetical protein